MFDPRSRSLLVLMLLASPFASHGTEREPAAATQTPGEADESLLGVYLTFAVAAGVSNGESSATSVHCTNLGASDAFLAATFLNFNGSNACTLFSDPVPAQGTWTGSTQATDVFFDDEVCANPTINQGLVRVGAAPGGSTDVLCTVHLVDPTGVPSFGTALEVHPR